MQGPEEDGIEHAATTQASLTVSASLGDEVTDIII